jgi:hypothetical protein
MWNFCEVLLLDAFSSQVVCNIEFQCRRLINGSVDALLGLWNNDVRYASAANCCT